MVLGFEPSGLFEKVILAPRIGTPRTLPAPEAGDDESEEDVIGSGLSGVGVASVFGTFGTLIFGIVIVNWPVAGWVRNKANARAAITMSDDDLVMNVFLSKK